MLENKIVLALLLSLLSLPAVHTVDAGSSGDTKGTDVIYLCGAPPTGGVWAQFAVGRETFNAYITDPTAIDDAIRLWQKPATATKRIPIGRLSCEPALWNCSWGWHQSPSSVSFANGAIEVCDGTPSYVEENCPSFGMGYYCPWEAVLVQLLDCRKDPGCPVVPR
jgi:hypothetical protein